jgi:hypothetical protein
VVALQFRAAPSSHGDSTEHPMMDVIMLAIGLAFFALSVGYVVACDRL